MHIHAINPMDAGFTPCDPSLPIRHKFLAIGEELAYGPLRHHGDLITWILLGPLAGICPRRPDLAQEIIAANGWPIAIGNIMRDGSIEFCWYPEILVGRNADYEHRLTRTLRSIARETVRAA